MGKSIGKPVLKLDPQAAIQGSEQAASSSAADSASNGRVVAAAKPPPQPPTSSNPDLNIDQWSDDKAPDDMDDDHWQNGNLGAQQAHYAEGESVPYRVVMSQLLEGHTYSVTILWDTTKNGRHALDYLTSWDRSFPADRDETIPDPIDGVTGLLVTTDETLAIPDNPLVLAGRDGILGNADDIDPADGFFTFFGGVDAGSLDASAYSQLAFTTTSSDSITLTFTYIGDGDATTEIGTAVLAWGGHIASRVDWGLDSSAGAISGSPYHMALDAFAIDGVDDNVGQQDRSLSSAAVVIPAVITVVKDASVNPDDPSPPDLTTTLFDFELTRLANTVDVNNGLMDLSGDGVSNGDDDGRFTDSGGEVFTVLNGVVIDEAGGDGTVNGIAIIAGVGLNTDGLDGITAADDANNLAGTGVVTFSLLDGGSKTFSLTDFGSGYVVKEVLDSAAWDLLSITTERTDINGVVTGAIINDPAGDQTSINLAEGDTWELEFDDNQVFLANPVLDIVKTFASIEEAVGSDDTDPDPNDTVDEAGDIIHYNITVENTGNVTMTDLVVTDPFADTGSIVRGADQVGDDDSDFEVGEIWTYTAEHTVTQDEMDVGGNLDTSDPLDGEFDVLHNVATATAVFGGDEYTDTDPEDVPVLLNRTLAIDKQFVDVTGGNDNGVADFVGDVINYQMLVTNTGNTALDNVQVEDPLLGGFLTGPDSGDTDLDGRLDVSETWTYTGSYTVTQDDLDGEGNAGDDYDIDNTATATADDTPPDDDSEEVPLVPDRALAIDKQFVDVTGGNDNGVADFVGDVINYKMLVTNTGNTALDNVQVEDPLLGGFLTLDSGDDDNDGRLDVSETWTYLGSYEVTQDDLDGEGNAGDDYDIDNTATATADDTPPDDDSEEVPLVLDRALNIDKQFVDVTGGNDNGVADFVGDVINYQMLVTNTGNTALDNVQVEDPLLGGFLTGPDSGDTDLDGRLDVSETWTYTGSYTVTQDDLNGEGNAGDDYDIDNTATATADDTPPDDDSEEVPLVPDPSQFILKTVVSVGGDSDGVADTACEEIIYDIKVTNDGNQTLHGLVVTDTLDSTVTEVLAGGFNAGDTNTDGLLDVGETWEYTANYVVTQKDLDTNGADDPGITPPDDQLGFIDNLATATAYDPDDVAVIDTDTASVAVVQNASIDVEKYVSLDDGATWLDADTATPETETGPLDCIKFKIVVTNDGNITLNTVELTDDQLDLNYDGVDDVITLSTLSVGGSYELIYELPWALGENTNTATASAFDYNGDAVGPVEDVAIYTGVV